MSFSPAYALSTSFHAVKTVILSLLRRTPRFSIFDHYLSVSIKKGNGCNPILKIWISAPLLTSCVLVPFRFSG